MMTHVSPLEDYSSIFDNQDMLYPTHFNTTNNSFGTNSKIPSRLTPKVSNIIPVLKEGSSPCDDTKQNVENQSSMDSTPSVTTNNSFGLNTDIKKSPIEKYMLSPKMDNTNAKYLTPPKNDTRQNLRITPVLKGPNSTKTATNFKMDNKMPKYLTPHHNNTKNKHQSITPILKEPNSTRFTMKPIDIVKPAISERPCLAEIELIHLKEYLCNWREVILYADRVLRFEDPQGFCFIFFTLTSSILCGRFFNPSTITTVSLIMLVSLLFHMVAPQLGPKLLAPVAWLPMHESRFEHLCEIILEINHQGSQFFRFCWQLRWNSPVLFVSLLVPILAFITLFGYRANNWTFAYVVMVILLVLPGMQHHGLFGKFGFQLLKVIQLRMGIKPRRR